jgi:hypothetical protein
MKWNDRMNQFHEFIAEAEFHDAWRVITKDSGDLFEYAEIRDRPMHQVWTIVESGDDSDRNWYAIPGIHTVNCVGFVLTQREWADASIQAVYFEDEEEDADNCNWRSA